MTSWRLWVAMAQESARAGAAARDAGYFRSSVSRSYYAAYQAMSALLLYRKLRPPQRAAERRESWSHAAVPELIREHLAALVPGKAVRNDMAQRVAALYRMRISADYLSSHRVTEHHAAIAEKNCGWLLKVTQKLLVAD